MYAFTETWLTADTLSSQLFGPEYEVFRSDRTSVNSDKMSGGGVLLAIRSALKPRQLFPPNCSIPEQVWVNVPLATSTLFICVVYIPPKRDNDRPLIEQHRDSLAWVTSMMKINDSVMIIGDFNFPALRWTRSPTNKLIPNLANTPTNQLKLDVLDDYSVANLKQLNDIPNISNNVLDLCFVSSDTPTCCSLLPAPQPLVKIDLFHFPLLVSISCKIHAFRASSCSFFHDFNNADFAGMCVYLNNINWNDLLHNLDANGAAETLMNILRQAIDTFVPRKERQPARYPPWTNERLRILKTAKRAALRKYSKHPTDRWRNFFWAASNRYSHLNNRLYHQHLHSIQNRLKRDPKKFWNHVNEQRKESGQPTVMVCDDTEATNPEDICDLFRSQFSSVFNDEIVDDAIISKAANNVPVRPPIGQHPFVNPDAVRRACLRLKGSTSCGPDGVPALVLKKCGTA